MKYTITILVLILTTNAWSQEFKSFLTKKVIVKTNLLNLLAKKPTITVEKFFTKTISAEVSFVHGQVNDFLYTDTYNYKGFLFRAKKYLNQVRYNKISGYCGLYVGNLKRDIQSTGGSIGSGGWFGYDSKNFSANSIRSGGSFGVVYIAKNKILIDLMTSLGYGKYTQYYKPDNQSKGYLDAQAWLSVGFYF